MVTFLCRHRSLSGLASLLLIAVCATAASVNRTIDDELGDSETGVVPSYSPPGSWSQGATCNGCYIQLDPDQTFKGTWHDSTHTPGDPEPRLVTAHFTGTAVYVYHVIANTVPYTSTLTNLTFTLDGQQVGTYVHVPTDSTAFQYDVPVYTNPSLSNKGHTLVIEATGDTASSLILFDYIVYTWEEEEPLPPPSSSSPPPTTTTLTTTTNQRTSLSLSPTVLPSSASTSLSLSLLSPTISPSSASTSLTSLQVSPSATSATSTISLSTAEPTAFVANTSQHGTAFPVGAVAGGVSGGVALITLAAVFLLCYKRRQRASQETLADPFEDGKPRGGVVSVAPSVWNGRVNMVQVDGAASHSRLLSTPSDSQPSTPPADMSSPSVYSTTNPPTVATGNLSVASHPYTPDSSRRAMRSAPDVPSSPSDFAATTVYDHDQIQSTAISIPPVQIYLVDEKSTSGMSEPDAPPPRPARRMLPVPPACELEPPVSPVSTSNPGTVTVLRTQVAALQEEVIRLRQEQGLLDEAPPRYNEARA